MSECKTSLWRTLAVAASAFLAAAPPVAAQDCVAPTARDFALSVEMLTTGPAELCAPAIRILQIRNRSDADLGDLALRIQAPEDVAAHRFVAGPGGGVFEYSADDGDTWLPLSSPAGDLALGGALDWSADLSEAFSRLGPAGSTSDSLLVRWRSALGDGLGPADAVDAPRIGLFASATDRCGVRIEAPEREARLVAARPFVSAIVEGRNVTRGGPFSSAPTAAPGDVVEWRITLRNLGAAIARNVRIAIRGSDGAPIDGFILADGEADVSPVGPSGVVAAPQLAPDGRGAVVVRRVVGPSCGRAQIVFEPSWGCAAPPAGMPSAFSAPLSSAFGVLDTDPSADSIRIDATVEDADGDERLGDRAAVRVVVEAAGPPLLDVDIETEAPDGYAIDLDAPIELFGARPGVRVALDPDADPTRPTFQLLSADGAPASLDTGRPIELRFTLRRVRGSFLERDAFTARAAFQDGCGERLLSRRARVDLRPRQARLEIAALGDAPVVSDVGDAAPMTFEVRNVGEAAAEGPFAEIMLGLGWADAPPARLDGGPDCAPAGRPRAYFCPLGASLAPGEAIALQVELSAAVGPQFGVGALSAAVDARWSADGAGDPDAPRLSRATIDVAGASVAVRLLSLGGAPLAADALDVGSAAIVEVTVEWFGLGDAPLEAASAALTLPAGLAYRADEALGPASVEARLAPRQGDSGRVVWSLVDGDAGDAEGRRRFVGRVVADIVDVAGAQTVRTARIDADVVFRLGPGVFRAAGDPGTPLAASLEASIRRPSARLTLALADLAAGTMDPGAETAAELSVSNDGDGPLFLDWVEISLPPGLEPEPFDADGIDTDGDGEVDEPDDGAGVRIERDGAGGARMRWAGGAGGVGAASRRLLAGETAALRFRLRLERETPPGAPLTVRMQADVAARPGAGGSGARVRLRDVALLRAASASGVVFVVSPSGGELTHGSEAIVRVSASPAPGLGPAAVLSADLPPGLADGAEAALRFGPAIECPDADADVRFAPRADGGVRVSAHLGRCEAAAGAPEPARAVTLDIAVSAVDADPDADADARAAWRALRIGARLSYAEDAAPTVGLGAARMRIVGPLLRVSSSLIEGAEGVDAGDPVSWRVVVENVGDRPAFALSLSAAPPDGGGLDCAALDWRLAAWRVLEDGAAPPQALISEPGPCGPIRALDLSASPLEPGGSATLEAFSALSADAARSAQPEGHDLVAPLIVVGRDAEGRAGRAAIAALAAPLRAPERPVLSAVADDSAFETLTPGDRIRVRVEAELVEGSGDARIGARFRLLRPDGSPFGPAPLRVVAASASSSRVDAAFAALGGPLFGAPRDVADVLEITPDADGWWSVALPLGGVEVEAPETGARPIAVRLDLDVEMRVDPSAASGRTLEAVSTLSLGAAPLFGDLREIGVIATPFLDPAAVLASDALDARPGAQALFEARACNRGDAPAYGAGLAAAFSADVLVDSSVRAWAAIGAPGAPISSLTPVFDRVEARAGSFVARAARPIAPGDCLRVFVPGRIAPDAVGDPSIAVQLLDYRGRPDVERPGRVWPGGARAGARAPLQRLVIEPTERPSEAEGGGWSAPIGLSGSPGEGAVRVSVAIDDPAGAVWTLRPDADGDGRADPGGEAITGAFDLDGVAGGTFTLETPDERAAGPRRVVVRLAGVDGDGRPIEGSVSLLVSRDPDAGALEVRRRFAIDRDCDGSLSDERAQDAAFEETKPASPGACLIVRLTYRNAGDRALAALTILDVAPLGSAPTGAAAPVATPLGLIAAPARFVGDAATFEFVGSIAPGEEGVVEYAVRVAIGP